MHRKPAVSGQFYPSDPLELSQLVDACYTHRLGPGRPPPAPESSAKVAAVVAPHAGYVYSGPVAAHSFLHVSSSPKPDLVVVIGPNHYGLGSGVSTFEEGDWETPLGKMRVDPDASRELLEACDVVRADPGAQRLEHSIEVQLPFLLKIYGEAVPFLPVSLIFQDLDTTSALSKAIAKVVRGKSVVLIASSDFTHYEPAETARKKDMALIKDIIDLDVKSFYETLQRSGVTACGFGAIATVMQAASALGLKKAELLRYASSGDTTGDNLQVVGYGALRFV